MNKTKIEWCDATWNPVTGCLHGCPYCYADRMTLRFSGHWDEKTMRTVGGDGGLHVLDEPMHRHTSGKNRDVGVHSVIAPFPFGFDPTLHRYRLSQPEKKKDGRTIFVCSMADLFGEWVPDAWIEEVFAACRKAPQHRYLFLTKNPARYIKLYEKGLLPMGENYWYGSTVTDGDKPMFSAMDFNCFLSIEPILGEFGFLSKHALPDMKWVILGAETGNRKGKVVPEKPWIEEVIRWAKVSGKPVFMKDSMVPIVGESNMVREFPWEVRP